MKSAILPYRYRPGSSPLVVSMPHVGTYVPPAIARDLTDIAASRPDTDWHLPRLYDFLDELDATVITATHSRYVVDLNRPPDDESLYPGRVTTGLVPRETFLGEALHRQGRGPDPAEVTRRVNRYWMPYHRRLAAELERVRTQHRVAVLWDAHSIVSVAPRLFDGRLPDFNLGTADGKSCDRTLEGRLAEALGKSRPFTSVVNGRFKGGYITRHFGRPAAGVHAVQMEMAETTYMQESSPFAFDEAGAARVRPVLRALLGIALDFTKGWK